jgi:predicted ribosomally synthesized peptide with SipW-like signal peptide
MFRSISVSPRQRVLAAACVLLLMLVATSFALFSDSGTVRSTVTAGSLDLRFDAGQDGSPTPYVVSFDGGDALAPGVPATYDLVVYNSGTIDASLSLDAPVLSNAVTDGDLLQDSLTLTVSDGGSTPLYSGPLAEATFADLAIGSGGTPQSGTDLALTLTMADDAPDSVSGQSVQLDLPFSAVQTVR